MLKKKSNSCLLSSSLIFTIIFIIFIQSYFLFSITKDAKNYNQNLDIRVSQGSVNLTRQYLFPEIIWLECQVELKITSNQSGQINIVLDNIGTESYFNTLTQNINITGNNQTQSIILKLQPKINTLPGRYQFVLNITGLFTDNQDFQSILGMGYIMMILYIGLFFIPLVFILIRKFEPKEDLITSTSKPPDTKVYETIEGLPSKKIMCPTCQEIIPEGLPICPECGERIPEFLRYSNPSI